MKRLTPCCAILVLCLAAAQASAVTAILTAQAEVHSTPQQVSDTLPAGAKVTTGTINGEWVAISYQKEGETAPRQGWVNRALLEEVPAGYDSRVSEHLILHSQDPANVDRFDLKVIEDFYRSISRSLLNAQNEPVFDPNVKLRIYLLNRETFRAQAKRLGEPDDSVAFSPGLGQACLDFSLRSATPPMKGLIVHELSRLVLRDYAMQPQGRAGAGGPLPVWIIEAFATYQEYQAGFNTDNLLYAPDKPHLSSLINARTVPTRYKDRRAYLATAGTLGYMLLNHGTKEQFSQFVRLLQTDGGRTRGDLLLCEFYRLTAASFRSEWIRYIDLLKDKHKIRQHEEEMEEGDDDDDGPFSGGTVDPDNPIGAQVENAVAGSLPEGTDYAGRRLFISRFLSKFFK